MMQQKKITTNQMYTRQQQHERCLSSTLCARSDCTAQCTLHIHVGHFNGKENTTAAFQRQLNFNAFFHKSYDFCEKCSQILRKTNKKKENLFKLLKITFN